MFGIDERDTQMRYSEEKEAFYREAIDTVQHHLHIVVPKDAISKFLLVIENDTFLQVVQKASEQAIVDAASTTDDGQRAVMCGQARAYIAISQMLQRLKRIAMGK